MTDLYLDHPTVALGDTRQSLAQAHAQNQIVSDPLSLAEAGFRTHFVSSPKQSAYDLAREAVQSIAGQLDSVGAIIYSTCLPANGSRQGMAEFQRHRDVKPMMDFPASHLQSDFDLHGARVIGLTQQACTGLLGAIGLARDMLIANSETERILCLSADRFPQGAVYEQAYNLMSDGAAACLLSREPSGFKVLAHHHVTNGGMVNVSDDETVGSFFNYSYHAIVDCLHKANLSMADIDWIVPQNFNFKAWEILSRLLGFDMARVIIDSLPVCGHMISGDNLLNLRELLNSGRIEKGQKLLTFMAGYGSNWQTLILERSST